MGRRANGFRRPVFSCAVRDNSFESYNCLFFEILYSLQPPPKGEPVDLAVWLNQPEAIEAGYLLWLLCRRSHALAQQNFIPSAAICRHWFNTLHEQLSAMPPEERAEIHVQPLFNGQTTAGEWYLAIPSYSASPEVGLRLIEQLTTPDREALRSNWASVYPPGQLITRLPRQGRYPYPGILAYRDRRCAKCSKPQSGDPLSASLEYNFLTFASCSGDAQSRKGGSRRFCPGRS